ncbi:MAG: type I-U CRISPR-associated RAMP protein Csb1/Cas7u [Nocardioidaceae bacterium]
MSIDDVYERLLVGVALEGDDAAIRFTTDLQPTGGPDTRLMPPTYPDGYLEAERWVDGEPIKTVLLDSYQSQANRVEEGLLDARDDGRVSLPLFEMRVDAEPWSIRLTSLDFPHRYADAYLRDSTIDGVRFDQTAIGKALRIAEPSNATELYHHDPVSLVLGAWNSHRDGRQPKFARVYRSEVIGLQPRADLRRGGRLDPVNLQGTIDDKTKREGDWAYLGAGDKKKGGKLSEIGHGNALADRDSPGGCTVSGVRRLGALSFAALGRLRFGGLGREATLAGRAALAALALVGDRLAFGGPGWVFRSGCELTVVADDLGWELRGGSVEPLALDVADALALYRHAVAAAAAVGLPMSTDTVSIEPVPSLRKAIETSLALADQD